MSDKPFLLHRSDQPGGGLVDDKKIKVTDSGGGPDGDDN